MLDILIVMLMTMVRPTAAFTIIRDNYDEYFWPSVGVFILPYILGWWFVTSMPFVSKLELPIFMDMPVSVFSIISGLVSVIIIWLIGWMLGGNRNWREVFSVVFSVHVLLTFVLIFTFAAVYIFIPQPLDNISDLESFIWPTFIFLIGALVWGIIIYVIAISVVHEFSILRAIAAILISTIPNVMFGLVLSV